MMWEFWGILLIIIFICWSIMVTYSLHVLDKKVSELEELLSSMSQELSKSSTRTRNTEEDNEESY